MSREDYNYRSTYWRTLRLKVFERDDWCCVLCDSREDLECHHRTYDRKGKELLRDCTTLCRPCHDVVTDHQRRTRYATKGLPSVQEVTSLGVAYKLGCSYQEVSIETNRDIPSDRHGTALDAQWAIERSTVRMDEGQEKDHGQTQENRSRSRRNRPSRMDGGSLSVQWSTVYSPRSHQGNVAASRNDVEKRP